MSSVSYLPQPGTAKIKMFSHDFEAFPLKKQNVEVKKGIGLMVLCKLLFGCHKR